MRRILILFSVIATTLIIPAGVFAQRSDLMEATRFIDWPNSTGDIARANRLPLKQIEDFNNSLTSEEYWPPFTVFDFRFVLVEEDKIALAVVVGDRDRPFRGLDIICPEKGKYRRTVLGGDGPHYLPTELLDLDGDGKVEVVTQKNVFSYNGAKTVYIYWHSIYKFYNGKAEHVDEKYPDYYRTNFIPQVHYISRLLEKDKQPQTFSTQQAGIEFVMLKYQRKIEGKRDEGLQEAIKWAASGKKELQELAVYTFQEIPGNESRSQLDRLAKSSDSSISMIAKRALAIQKH